MSAAPEYTQTGSQHGLRDPMLMGEALLQLLDVEMRATQEERASYKTLDASQILERAREKEIFSGTIARYHAELASILAALPTRPSRLKDLLGKIRKRSKELARQQLLNARLAERTLECVNGYLRAVAPPNNAYDRRGARRRQLMGQARQSHSRFSRKV